MSCQERHAGQTHEQSCSLIASCVFRPEAESDGIQLRRKSEQEVCLVAHPDSHARRFIVNAFLNHSLLPNSCRKDKNKGHRTVLSWALWPFPASSSAGESCSLFTGSASRCIRSYLLPLLHPPAILCKLLLLSSDPVTGRQVAHV